MLHHSRPRPPKRWFRVLCAASAAALLTTTTLSRAEQVLFSFEGRDYTAEDLPPRLALAHFELEFEHHHKLSQLVEDAVFDAYLQREAQRTGRDAIDVRRELLSVAGPDDAEVQAFYRDNAARINAPLAQVRERLVEIMTVQRIQARQRELVAQLRGDGSFVEHLPLPLAPRVDIDVGGFPAKGAAQPAVTVVEFADFQGPYCKAASGVLDDLLTRHGERMRRVFIDFPINPSGIARQVARGAVCAGRQQRFWDYHDLAFRLQRQLDEGAPRRLAQELGLTLAEFDACYAAPDTEQAIVRAEREARRLGLDSTPSIFVNGRLIVIQDMERDLRRAVEQAIAEAPSH